MFGDNCYPVVVESFRYLVDRMVVEEEQTQTDGYEMSTTQLNTNLWEPRVTGSITFISSACMLLMAWKRRNLLFHRLVLGKKKRHKGSLLPTVSCQQIISIEYPISNNLLYIH